MNLGVIGRLPASATILVIASGCARPSEPPRDPTFTRDIAPIVYSQCATCHRPGEVGPFPLLTYADVKARARQIAEVTASRFMPPWMPEAGHGDFVGERRLTDAQIATIKRWVERGAPEGEKDDLPKMPRFPSGWQLGTPDVVVTMPSPRPVPAEGDDEFAVIAIPLPLDGTRYVRAVEFRPGNPRAVHHAMVRLIRGSAFAKSADRSAGVREISSDGMVATEEGMVSPDGHVLGWAPGYSPHVAPRGMTWRLEPPVALAIELHLQPTGKPEQVQSSVGLFFTDEPPARVPFGLQLGSYVIDIPPGARDYTIEDRYELPVDVELHAIYPHAHYLGKDIRAFATLPDGTERPLIWIRHWDFNWQNAYRYREPMRLPRGTIVRMRYTYDNSADNPRNPSKPPVRVRYGGRSSDEMGNLWMQVVPVNPADATALRADYERASAERRIAGFEQLLRERPEAQRARAELGAMYLRVGRTGDAVKALRAALEQGSPDASGHYNLGLALAAQGELQQAAAQFRRATQLEPLFVEAHNNLGAVLRQAGDLPGAERAFRAAVAAGPRYAPAHNNLGSIKRVRGDLRGALHALEEAVRLDEGLVDAHLNLGVAYQEAGDRPAATRHLRRAIELQPSNAEGYNALAWLLATAPDATPAAAAEAVGLAQRAAALTQGRDASVLDTLAAALAATGDLERAASAAERALQVAHANRQEELAVQIRRRLDLYRGNRR